LIAHSGHVYVGSRDGRLWRHAEVGAQPAMAFSVGFSSPLSALAIEARTVLHEASASARLQVAPFSPRPLLGVEQAALGLAQSRRQTSCTRTLSGQHAVGVRALSSQRVRTGRSGGAQGLKCLAGGEQAKGGVARAQC
jgi:hypothetical protein